METASVPRMTASMFTRARHSRGPFIRAPKICNAALIVELDAPIPAARRTPLRRTPIPRPCWLLCCAALRATYGKQLHMQPGAMWRVWPGRPRGRCDQTRSTSPDCQRRLNTQTQDGSISRSSISGSSSGFMPVAAIHPVLIAGCRRRSCRGAQTLSAGPTTRYFETPSETGKLHLAPAPVISAARTRCADPRQSASRSGPPSSGNGRRSM